MWTMTVRRKCLKRWNKTSQHLRGRLQVWGSMWQQACNLNPVCCIGEGSCWSIRGYHKSKYQNPNKNFTWRQSQKNGKDDVVHGESDPLILVLSAKNEARKITAHDDGITHDSSSSDTYQFQKHLDNLVHVLAPKPPGVQHWSQQCNNEAGPSSLVKQNVHNPMQLLDIKRGWTKKRGRPW